MAQVDIDIKVSGEEKLKALEKSIKGVDTNTKLSTKSLVGWTAGLTATAYAISKVAEAGHDYLTNLEDVNNQIVTTTTLENELATSFGMASASILEQTGLWDAYREILIEVSNGLDVIAGKQAIIRQANAEHVEMEKEYQKMLLENEKIEERKSKAKLRQIKVENDANVRHQKLLTAFEERARVAAEAEEKAYEDKLKALDAAIDAINAETQAQVDNIEVKQQAVEVTDDLVESLNQQADASNKAAEDSGGGSYSATVSAESQSKNDYKYASYMQSQGYNMSAEFARLADLQKRMYEEQRKTNDLIGG